MAIVVILGLALGLCGIIFLSAVERGQLGRRAANQQSIVTLSALAQLVTSTHALGGDLQQAVSTFATHHEDVVVATVYGFRNRELLASTDPQYASGPWPQPLERRNPSRKTWTELGSRLQSALELNRRQSQKMREEIAIDRIANDHLTLATPIAYGGHIHPIVVILEARGEAVPLAGLQILAGVLLIAIPVLVLFIGARLQLGGGRATVAVAVVVGLSLGVFFFAADRQLRAANRVAQQQVAARVLAEHQRLQDLGLNPRILQPETWDVDLFRQPRGVILADGLWDDAKVEALLKDPQLRFRQRGAGVTGVAVVLSVLVAWWLIRQRRVTI